MKLKNKTPKALQCGIGACPAIFETDRNTYILIGADLANQKVGKKLAKKIGVQETAIEIPKALLREINK